jgi:hypothetical protein
MSRKAISERVTLWIPKMIFLAIVVVTVVFLTRFIAAIYIQTADAQATVYINKILYDKDGIIRYENGRAYPGVIDLAKFNDLRLSQSMKYAEGDEGPCAKLELKNLETGEKKTAFWNNLWFQRLRPRAGFRGVGSPFLKQAKALVSIYIDGKYVPAMLDIEMVVPRK